MTPIAVNAFEIEPAGSLDRIQVFLVDSARYKGSITITCWGCAWTAYFGGMMCPTIREFVLMIDVGYLVDKLGINPTLKQRKQDMAYLTRIVEAVKGALKAVPE